MLGNVLHVASWAGRSPGNFMALLEASARELARDGIEQGYLFPAAAADRHWIPDLAERAYVDFVPLSPLGQVDMIRKAIRHTNARIVHTWFNRYDLAAWIASLGSSAQVLWHMSSERAVPRTPMWLIKDVIKYRTIGRSTNVVAVSESVGDWIVSRGMPRKKTITVENGADIARATSASASRQELRATLGIAPSTLCLVLFGWEPERKGIDLAVSGLQPLIPQVDLRLLLVADDQADVHVRRSLGYEIPNWAPRLKRRDTVADFYAIADIFLSASRFEGHPFAVIEAIAAGTPVVSSDIRAMAWAKRVPSVTFFPLERPELLADAVRTVTSWTPEERARRTAEGRRIVADNYSAEAWARRMVAVYRSL